MSATATSVIRAATEADLPRLMELLFELSRLGELPEGEPAPVTESHRRALRALQNDSRTTCLVVEAAGRVVGTLTLYLLPNLSHGSRPAALVENVVTDVAVRGQGFGRLLMARAEEWARQQGCYKIELLSNRRRTDAHGFYEGLGFRRSHAGMTKYFDKED